MRYLGIDYGDAHIGIAFGDDETNTALPFETLQNEGLLVFLSYLAEAITKEVIGAVVVGVPSMGSAYGEQRAHIEGVIHSLQGTLSIPVYAADESFSSREAQTLLRDKGAAPSTDEHAIAAMLILQGFLDQRKNLQTK